jgi:hypothetical protein
MKYFLDTEFIESTQSTLFGKTKPTIDLISIGIVAEDGREYYAISKDFNLKEAWNRYDRAEQTMFEKQNCFKGRKIYWIRDNVLKSIFNELLKNSNVNNSLFVNKTNFTYSNLKRLIDKYGKNNKQIAEEVINFSNRSYASINREGNKVYKIEWEEWRELTREIGLRCDDNTLGRIERENAITYDNPIFYGYYSDYDWVVFCWLFGKMIDLPKGFPMYCIDLKQILDEYVLNKCGGNTNETSRYLLNLKDQLDYPKQINEHNALEDAKWNYELYKFLQIL